MMKMQRADLDVTCLIRVLFWILQISVWCVVRMINQSMILIHVFFDPLAPLKNRHGYFEELQVVYLPELNVAFAISSVLTRQSLSPLNIILLMRHSHGNLPPPTKGTKPRRRPSARLAASGKMKMVKSKSKRISNRWRSTAKSSASSHTPRYLTIHYYFFN